MSSSSHGAGRVLSRRQAKDTLDVNTFHDDMIGIVTNHTDDTLDEAPQAYKNIFEVMELQKDLVEVVDRIKPLINIKG
jgi:tRNA-splicing ligase RtcB